MTGELALGPGREFDAIRELLARWGSRATGIGDDAAVVQLPRGDALVASVDTAVEGRHFRRGWISPREIGYRATTAALSDLAAMAARPTGILVALSIPEAWRAELIEIADGIAEAVDAAHARILGGNLTSGTELSITTTVLGSAYAPLTRGDARAGDGVYVTGRLGGSGAELEALLNGAPATAHRTRFVHPVARISEALWLADRGASSAIDISDGLAADARHLAAASSVSLSIDASLIPCSDRVAVERAVESGEEYELLVTSPTAFDVVEFESRFGIPLTRIGDVTKDAPPGVTILGARVASVAGYDHFSLMRTLFVAIVASIVTLIFGPPVILARIFRVPQGPNSIYTKSVRRWAKVINWAAGVEVRVHNGERLVQPHGAVCIANHVSWFDILPLAAELPWCTFVAKRELSRIPLFGFAARAVGIVFLERDNRKQAFQSYEEAAEEVKQGRIILVCPEGTRGTDYHLRPFKKGPFVLAIASQAPIIPTVVYGAREVMPKGTFWIKSGVVDLHFLEPVPTAGYSYDQRAELMTVVWNRMADELRDLYHVSTSEHPVANQA